MSSQPHRCTRCEPDSHRRMRSSLGERKREGGEREGEGEGGEGDRKREREKKVEEGIL